MAAAGDRLARAEAGLKASIDEWRAAMLEAEGPDLGNGLIQSREATSRIEAVFAEGLRRFDKSGEYRSEGAVDVIAWLRSRCHLPGGEAKERLGIAHQIDHLPQTKKAFASGELAYHHVAVMARTADHVGAAVVRKAESSLLSLASTMDPGQFTGAAKNFEHRVDAEAVLAEANRAHERRYLNISEPLDGMVRIEGQLDAEAGAVVRNTLYAGGPPSPGDERTPAQRRADRLVDICLKKGAGPGDGSGPRPHLVIRASVDTLAREANAPGGEIDGGGTLPAETVRRLACDCALTRITGTGELEAEVTRATRTIPSPTRRALADRDRGCVADRCDRPPQWTDAHHVKHWTHGGPTTLSNLILLCRPHHRMVHEQGFGLRRLTTGRWALMPPVPRSRSA